MRGDVATFDESLLLWKKEGVDCAHDVVGEGGCDDAIVGIGDGDGAGLIDVDLSVFGNEVQQSMVEAFWGAGPITKGSDDPEEDGGSVLGESPVEREVKTIWAGA